MSVPKTPNNVPVGYIVALSVMVAGIGGAVAAISGPASLIELYAFLLSLVLGTLRALLQLRRR
jgi:hypothetical protein